MPKMNIHDVGDLLDQDASNLTEAEKKLKEQTEYEDWLSNAQLEEISNQEERDREERDSQNYMDRMLDAALDEAYYDSYGFDTY